MTTLSAEVEAALEWADITAKHEHNSTHTLAAEVRRLHARVRELEERLRDCIPIAGSKAARMKP